jgi:hypothetical protein
MKKWRLPLTLALLALLGFVLLTPRKVHYDIRSPYSMDVTGRILNRPEKVATWYLPFNTKDSNSLRISPMPASIRSGDDQLRIVSITSLSGIYSVSQGKDSADFLFTAKHDTVDISSLISLVYKTSLFNQLTGGNTLERNARVSLDNLEEKLKDPAFFYGWPLRRITVEDTSFLTARKKVGPNELQKGRKELFDMLLKAAKDRDAGYNGVRIFHPVKDGDGWSLFAGVGVTKHFDTPENEPIQYRMMPYKKSLLVCDYKGPYYNVEKINAALKQYVDDHQMINMAIPFEKILQDSYDFGDSAIVNLRITFPFQ